MTNNSPDRLDRIERILEVTAQGLESSKARLTRLEELANRTLSIAQRNREDIDRNQEAANARLISIEEAANARLTRLEELASTTLSIAQKNREDIERTEELTRRNASAIARLDEKMEQYLIEGRENREFIALQVEGIKIETRRILEHLFGQSNNPQ